MPDRDTWPCSNALRLATLELPCVISICEVNEKSTVKVFGAIQNLLHLDLEGCILVDFLLLFYISQVPRISYCITAIFGVLIGQQSTHECVWMGIWDYYEWDDHEPQKPPAGPYLKCFKSSSVGTTCLHICVYACRHVCVYVYTRTRMQMHIVHNFQVQL